MQISHLVLHRANIEKREVNVKSSLKVGLLVVGGALVIEHFVSPKGSSILSKTFGSLGKHVTSGHWAHDDVGNVYRISDDGTFVSVHPDMRLTKSGRYESISAPAPFTGWGHGEMPSPFGYSAYGSYGWPHGGGGHGGYPYG
jgi:hypothetical protein